MEQIFYFFKVFVQVYIGMILISSLIGFQKNKFSVSHFRYNTFGLVISFFQFAISIIFFITNNLLNQSLFNNIFFGFLPVLFIFICAFFESIWDFSVIGCCDQNRANLIPISSSILAIVVCNNLPGNLAAIAVPK